VTDSLTRFHFADAPVRGALVSLDATWAEVRVRAAPEASFEALLGEALAAVALMRATLKFSGSVALQVQSAGALKLLYAQCTTEGQLRGLVRGSGALDFKGLSDHGGRMAITLEPNAGEQRYQGIVELGGATLADALSGYFERSEQLETVVLLAASATRAAGLLLQRLPDHGGHTATGAHERFEHLAILARTTSIDELLTLDSHALLTRLFHADAVRVEPADRLAFGCRCSRERVAAMLLGLGAAEANAALTERGLVEVSCEFCNAAYRFDRVDLDGLFAGAHAPSLKIQ
jgi:molecular chaperone Hsp33